MLEMFLFIIGVYTFVFGRVSLPWNLSIDGWRARIAALFLMAPFPILFLLGRVVGRGVQDNTALSFYGIMELIIVILGILGAVLFAHLTKPKIDETTNEAKTIKNRIYAGQEKSGMFGWV